MINLRDEDLHNFDEVPKREVISLPCSTTLSNLQLKHKQNIPNDECSNKAYGEAMVKSISTHALIL